MMNFYQLEIKDFPKLDLLAYTDLIRVESIMNEED